MAGMVPGAEGVSLHECDSVLLKRHIFHSKNVVLFILMHKI